MNITLITPFAPAIPKTHVHILQDQWADSPITRPSPRGVLDELTKLEKLELSLAYNCHPHFFIGKVINIAYGL